MTSKPKIVLPESVEPTSTLMCSPDCRSLQSHATYNGVCAASESGDTLVHSWSPCYPALTYISAVCEIEYAAGVAASVYPIEYPPNSSSRDLLIDEAITQARNPQQSVLHTRRSQWFVQSVRGSTEWFAVSAKEPAKTLTRVQRVRT